MKEKNVNKERRTAEILLSDIAGKIKEIEREPERLKKSVFLNGYYKEVQDAHKGLYNFLNDGGDGKNYVDGMIELKALCKVKADELSGKTDLLSNGKLKALLDLGTGFGKAAEIMSGKKGGMLFSGIDLERECRKEENRKMKRGRR